jgi:hypothetical protein
MEKEKKCNTCSIILSDEIKVKGKNICKICHNKKSHEYYITKLQPKVLAKKEEKLKVEKKCNKCSIVLSDDNMVKDRNICKDCRSKQYKEYVKTKLSKQYENFNGDRKCSNCQDILTAENCTKNRPICKSCYNAKCKDYKLSNKDKVSENNKAYYEANKEKMAAHNKKNYEDNKETYMANKKIWREANREKIRAKENARLNSNPTLRLKKNCRFRIWSALKYKKKKTVEYLDCSIDFLEKWLEYNFTEDMNFDNYGSYWHVDHVIPCSKFNLDIDEDIEHCFRWTNLQPLKASINVSKQGNINNDEIISHYKKVKKFAKQNNINIPKFNYKSYLINEIEV